MLPPTRKGAKNSSLAATIVVCLLTFQLEIANCVLTHEGYIQLDDFLKTRSEVLHFGSYLGSVREKYNILPTFHAFPKLTEALREVGPMAWLPVDQPNNLLCDVDEYLKLYLGTFRTKSQRFEFTPSSRLEWLIHQISMKHAHECMPKYTHKFFEISSTWTWPNVYMKFLYNKVTQKYKAQENLQEYYLYLLYTNYIGSDKTLNTAVSHIKARMRGRNAIVTNDVDVLYHAYVAEPCQQYVDHFDSVLAPAVFEEQMFRSVEEAYDMNRQNFVNYLMARATFLACYSLANDQVLRDKVIEKLPNPNP